MRKITKKHIPDEKKYIFTEGIDYTKTGKNSIWGKGHDATKIAIRKAGITGKWLNIAAGDGRYNPELLEEADHVIASDIDEGSLSKLWYTTSRKYSSKLETKVFDITKRFPFANNSFDGVFNSGALHLFPRKIFPMIIHEIDRVLKPTGTFILEFATDIERLAPNGDLITFGDEPLYSLAEAKKQLRELLDGYKVSFKVSAFQDEFKDANPPYKYKVNNLIMVAKKGNQVRS